MMAGYQINMDQPNVFEVLSKFGGSVGGKKAASAAAGAIVSWWFSLCLASSSCTSTTKSALVLTDTVLICVVESRPLTGSGRLLLRSADRLQESSGGF